MLKTMKLSALGLAAVFCFSCSGVEGLITTPAEGENSFTLQAAKKPVPPKPSVKPSSPPAKKPPPPKASAAPAKSPPPPKASTAPAKKLPPPKKK